VEGAGKAGNAADALAAELKELKDPEHRKFHTHPVGVRGVIFLSYHPPKHEANPPDIVEVVMGVVKPVAETKVLKCKHATRLIPVQHSCFASLEELKKLAGEQVPKEYPGDPENPEKQLATYSIFFEHRASAKFDRMAVINAVADLVPKNYKVDIKHGTRTVVVQMVKSTCCLTFLDGFNKYSKLNLKQLAGVSDQ